MRIESDWSHASMFWNMVTSSSKSSSDSISAAFKTPGRANPIEFSRPFFLMRNYCLIEYQVRSHGSRLDGNEWPTRTFFQGHETETSRRILRNSRLRSAQSLFKVFVRKQIYGIYATTLNTTLGLKPESEKKDLRRMGATCAMSSGDL